MFFRELFLEIKEVAIPLYKILIPFVFIIKFFEVIGAIDFISKIFAPLMGLIGLPPELGIVWVTAITINIYAALVLLINLIPGLDVTVAQITILTTGILVCHNILIESAISKSAGVSFIYTSLFRLFSAFIICFILNSIYEAFNYLDYIYVPLFSIEPPQPGYVNWIIDEIKNLGIIFVIIVILITILKILGSEKAYVAVNFDHNAKACAFDILGKELIELALKFTSYFQCHILNKVGIENIDLVLNLGPQINKVIRTDSIFSIFEALDVLPINKIKFIIYYDNEYNLGQLKKCVLNTNCVEKCINIDFNSYHELERCILNYNEYTAFADDEL